jgi:hypothetical protein
MRELSSVVLELERQGKRLYSMLRVGRLNTFTWEEFQELVGVVQRLECNLTDFNVAYFGAHSTTLTEGSGDPGNRTRPK